MVAVCMHLNFKMRDVFQTKKNPIGELNARIEDSLLGQKVVKAFTNEQMETNEFETNNRQFFDIKRDSYHLIAVFNATTHAFDGAMYVSAFRQHIYDKGMGRGRRPGGVSFVCDDADCDDPQDYRVCGTVPARHDELNGFCRSSMRTSEIFDEADAVEMGEPKGEIAFHNVSFEYPDDHNQVFKNLEPDNSSGRKGSIGRTFRRRKNNAVQPDPAFL